MATFKAVVLKGQKNKKELSNIKILIVQHGDTAYIKTDYYIEPKFMLDSGKIQKKHPNFDELNQKLGIKILEYERKIIGLGDTAKYLSAKQIKEFLNTKNLEQIDFFEYAVRRINHLKDTGKRTHQIYSDSIVQIKEFVGRPILPFNEITVSFLERFETHSKDVKKRKVNTISVYLRAMNTIFKSAMDELNKEGFDPVILYDPFRKYKIKSEPTRKRNISTDIIIQIRDYDCKTSSQRIACDMFMLTFYLIGINTIDLFNAGKLKNGRLEYTRAKTASKNGRKYSIKVEPEAMELINKYAGVKYLLRFGDTSREERTEVHVKHYRKVGEYLDHKAFGSNINKALKDIFKKLSLPERVTTYWARHSWATVARNVCNISTDDISMALGHSDPQKKVTAIYLEEDLQLIDIANRKVLDALLTKKPEDIRS